jgi:hypothetical protein
MAQRFASKNIQVTAAGATLAHGLAATPDEFWLNIRGVPTVSSSNVASFSTIAVDTTNVNVLAGTTQTIDVFAAVTWTGIR